MIMFRGQSLLNSSLIKTVTHNDVSAIDGPDELRAEAVRLIKNTLWVPGINKGKKVNSWRQIPVDFDLNVPLAFLIIIPF